MPKKMMRNFESSELAHTACKGWILLNILECSESSWVGGLRIFFRSKLNRRKCIYFLIFRLGEFSKILQWLRLSSTPLYFNDRWIWRETGERGEPTRHKSVNVRNKLKYANISHSRHYRTRANEFSKHFVACEKIICLAFTVFTSPQQWIWLTHISTQSVLEVNFKANSLTLKVSSQWTSGRSSSYDRIKFVWNVNWVEFSTSSKTWTFPKVGSLLSCCVPFRATAPM